MRADSAIRRPISSLGGLCLALVLSACAWFTDFKQQPKVDPWETIADSIPPRANPQGSVPIYGSAAPGFAYGRAMTIGAVDSMSAIANPAPMDEESLRRGGQLYQINCSVCHGDQGGGDGPVTKFRLPVLPIGAGTKAATQMTDGAIFGIIRNGRGLMPPYNRLEEQERWDIVNYLRAVQRGTANPSMARLGRPGETGDLVLRATVTAPTRPAPHFKPTAAAPPALPAPPTPRTP